MSLRASVSIAALLVAAGSGLAQFPFRDAYDLDRPALSIVPEYVFARVQFQTSRARRRPGWSHDYPRAEQNLLRILSEVTGLHTESAAYTIVSLESPEIMKYPVLYFSEPGTWAISAEEAANLRDYLSRGGFAIFDDFDGDWDWEVFEGAMARVLPGRHFERLTVEDPVYQSFFAIADLDVITHPMGHAGPPLFLRSASAPSGERRTCSVGAYGS